MTPANILTYANFDLLIDGSGGQYRARVLESPAGQGETAFSGPFSEMELENFILRVGRPRRGIRRLDSPQMQTARDFGARLFDAVFRDDVLVSFQSSLDQAAAQEKGLRIRLRVHAPDLSNMPWEYLYNSRRKSFLSLANATPLVRYLDLPRPPRALRIQPPLNILVMISSPQDYPPLDVEHEWQQMKDTLAEIEGRNLVHLERLERATLPALQKRLRRGDVHILHYIGHGKYDAASQDGQLLLEDQRGQGQLKSGYDLGIVLQNHPSVRLVVLNACEGARTSPEDPFAGAAQSVVQQGVPAVVAMQFEISDRAASDFANEFYSALADNYPVDAALAEARLAIYLEGNDIEWGTPVYFSCAPDGRIFEIDTAQPPLSPPGPTPTHSSRPEAELEQKLDQLYNDGLEAYVLQDWEHACQIYLSIVKIRPDYQDAPERLREAERQLELANLYAQAARLGQGQRWQAVASIFEQIHAQRPDYPDPEGLEGQARRALEAQALHRQALAALDARQWEQAAGLLGQLLAEFPDYPNAVN